MPNATRPFGLQVPPDLSEMYKRHVDYRDGRDRLDSVAHFYLAELIKSGSHEPGEGSDRQKTAVAYRIDKDVLKAIDRLSSNHLQRAEGKVAPLQPEERRFLENATYEIFMRTWIATHSPDETLHWIKMSDLPSPRKSPQEIKLPREEAQTLFAAGKQLRQTAIDLYQVLERQTPPYRFDRFAGQSICVPVLQALAAEYLLKGLSVRESETYRQTHDLYALYEALNPNTKADIAALSTSSSKLDRPKFLEEHWNDFVNWRYVMEGRLAEANPPKFDSVLAVLIGASDNHRQAQPRG